MTTFGGATFPLSREDRLPIGYPGSTPDLDPWFVADVGSLRILARKVQRLESHYRGQGWPRTGPVRESQPVRPQIPIAATIVVVVESDFHGMRSRW